MHPTFCSNVPQSLLGTCLESWKSNQKIVSSVEVWMIYNNIVLVSGVQQSDSVSYICYCCQVASVVSDSVQPHRRQPTKFPRPWDSPGKNTGVGCHFLLQCMKVKSESEVAQLCWTPRDPMGCSLPGSFIHGIFQARVLE